MIIDSKAAIKRIPVGTRLILINSLLGPCNLPRTVIATTSNALQLRQDDKGPEARVSWLYLDQPMQVIPTGENKDYGFRIITGGKICAEYVFRKEES